jgi:serine/threonine protein kinase
MTPERWQQIDRLFNAALACEPEDRSQFLSNQCAADDALRREVESLLSALEEADDFIETPAGDVAAEMLGAHQAHFEPGQEIEDYRIVRQLGSGGMGEVYLAKDIRLNRNVALKLLPPQFTLNPDRVRRFEREARAASALNHPNIVTIYEIGHANSTHFIATEFVDGKTLRQLINEKPFTLNETLNVSMQVADALSGAHAAGIVHRDIKPENIMIRRDGYVKILDFGLAKLTEQQTINADLETPTLLQSNPGLVMGTVQYMSPEQARAKKVGIGTDIWSLGIVMYELLAGHVPFTGETPSHVMVSLMEEKLPPLKHQANVPDELDQFVTKALHKNQRERYQSAGRLARDLRTLKHRLQRDSSLMAWLNTVPSQAQTLVAGEATNMRTVTTGAAAVAPAPVRINWKPIAAVAVLLVVAAGGIAGLYAYRRQRAQENLTHVEIQSPSQSQSSRSSQPTEPANNSVAPNSESEGAPETAKTNQAKTDKSKTEPRTETQNAQTNPDPFKNFPSPDKFDPAHAGDPNGGRDRNSQPGQPPLDPMRPLGDDRRPPILQPEVRVLPNGGRIIKRPDGAVILIAPNGKTTTIPPPPDRRGKRNPNGNDNDNRPQP